MPTLNEYKKLLKKTKHSMSLLPLFEIIEDVFERRESRVLLLHHHQTIESCDLNAYDKILFDSYQKKEAQLCEYVNSPTYTTKEYERKIQLRDRASNNYLAFNSALNLLKEHARK